MLTLLPGCIFVAVRGVQAIDRKIDPPQQTLVASAHFGSNLAVTIRLQPVREHRHRWLLGGGEDEEAPAISEAEPPPPPGDPETEAPKVHKNLVVILFNPGTTTVTLWPTGVNSALGNFVPRPGMISLAPFQRAVLEPLPSTSEPKIGSLDVTIVLRIGESTQTQTLHLIPPAKKKDSAD